MADDNTLVTIKLRKEVLPGYDASNPTSNFVQEAKAFFIVAPYSVSFEKGFNLYTSGYYKKHNRSMLDARHIMCGAVPIFATVNEGMWITQDELKMFIKDSEAYTGLITEVRNGNIEIKSGSTIYSASDLYTMHLS
jgi:hypothetical protein